MYLNFSSYLCSTSQPIKKNVMDNRLEKIARLNYWNDKRLYVQVPWTLEDKQTEEREYASLEAIDDSYPKILVTMDDIPFKNRKGIENIQAWRLEEFLGL